MKDTTSDEYTYWKKLVSSAKSLEGGIPDLQAEVARYTLRGEEGENLEHLVGYLRTTAGAGRIDPTVATLLAAALDPKSDSDVQLVLRRRKKRVRSLSLRAQRQGFDIALQVENLVEGGMSKEAAVAEVVHTSGMSTTQVYEWGKRRLLHLNEMATSTVLAEEVRLRREAE